MNRSSVRIFTLFILIASLGVAAFASTPDKKGKDKNNNVGTLSVKTAGGSFPVIVNGKEVGMSGVDDYANFYLEPGVHTVEVGGPNGKSFVKEVEIRKGRKHCICLKVVETSLSRKCPYNFQLEGPDRVLEGDLITFAAVNTEGTSPVPLVYNWLVSPTDLKVSSGLGTPAITVDTTGLGGRTINAELDVNDDVYDSRCRQVISVPTYVEEKSIPQAFQCDDFPAISNDDDKARFDNCVIQSQNIPESRIFVVIKPGSDRASTTRNTFDRVSKRTLDYLVKERGFDPRRIDIVRGSSTDRTTYQIWIIPPGAQPPTY